MANYVRIKITGVFPYIIQVIKCYILNYVVCLKIFEYLKLKI